jgi:hypothetical protein
MDKENIIHTDTHTHTHTPWNILSHKEKNEIISFVEKWMELEIVRVR